MYSAIVVSLFLDEFDKWITGGINKINKQKTHMPYALTLTGMRVLLLILKKNII